MDNTFKIITERNSVSIILDVITKFINTIEDLVSINNSIENLSGYYILMNDLDLTDYLAKEGYNDGLGWTPIGLFKESTTAITLPSVTVDFEKSNG